MLRTCLLWILLVLAAPISGAWGQPEPAAEAPATATSAAPEAETPAAEPAPSPDLLSPRDTVFTFLEAYPGALEGRADDLRRALSTMDLSKLGAVSEDRAYDLVFKLINVIDRLGEVKHEELPGVDEVADAGIHRFIFFPRTVVHNWIWEKLPELNSGPPNGRIELVEITPGKWQFSATTIEGLDALYESIKVLPPKYIPGEDGVQSNVAEQLGSTFARTFWWNWFTLLACIFLGMVAGKVAQASLRRVGEQLEQRHRSVQALILHDAASPASLTLMTIGIMVGLQFIYLEPRIRDFAWKVLLFLFLIAAGWFIFNLVDLIDLALRRAAEKTESNLDDMVAPLVRKTLRVFLVIVFSIVVLQNVFELNITGFLASLGIAGLAVSLAAQDSVKNLFGSLTVFFDQPFTVGQAITFDGNTGAVEEIGFRSTRIRLGNGNLLTVPNMKFIDNKIENISARPSVFREMNVTITCDTPPEKIEQAVEILRGILRDPQVVEDGRFDMEKSPPRIFFDNFNADSLNIKVQYWYQFESNPERTYFTYMAHAEQINLRLARAFAEAGIEFAFPTRTLFLAGDPQRKLTIDANVTGLPGLDAKAEPETKRDEPSGGEPRVERPARPEPRRTEPRRNDSDLGEGGKAYT